MKTINQKIRRLIALVSTNRLNNVLLAIDKVMLEKHGVSLVLLFGSQVTGLTHPGSDIDIGVVFFDKTDLKNNPVEVYDDLRREFAKKFKTQSIDLVYLEETPLSLQFSAVSDSKILYQSSQTTFADYKERVLNYYFDFKFTENIFNQALIQP